MPATKIASALLTALLVFTALRVLIFAGRPPSPHPAPRVSICAAAPPAPQPPVVPPSRPVVVPPPNAGPVLTLDQAVANGLEYHPSIKQAFERIGAQAAVVRRAIAAPH